MGTSIMPVVDTILRSAKWDEPIDMLVRALFDDEANARTMRGMYATGAG